MDLNDGSSPQSIHEPCQDLISDYIETDRIRDQSHHASGDVASTSKATPGEFITDTKQEYANRGSLLDDCESDLETSQHGPLSPPYTDLLEMEEEEILTHSPARHPASTSAGSAPVAGPRTASRAKKAPYDRYEPIQTSSGLLLTHRRYVPEETLRHRLSPMTIPLFSPTDARARHSFFARHQQQQNSQAFGTFGVPLPVPRRLEVEHTYSDYLAGRQQSFSYQAQRLLKFVKAWVWLSVVVLAIGTMVLVHHLRHDASQKAVAIDTKASDSVVVLRAGHNNAWPTKAADQADVPDQIILVPLPDAVSRQISRHHSFGGMRRKLRDLRSDFEAWTQQHNKLYPSQEEADRRFQIWADNHHRTMEKNRRHGPCTLTKQPVFGSTVFQDLTPQEFQARYLTGYTGPRHDETRARRVQATRVLDPAQAQPHHRRRAQEAAAASSVEHALYGRNYYHCKWYDVSCNLNYIFDTYLYGLTGTMEPAYDEKSYPSSVDWRNSGAVTSVRSQGNCGACWAITAIETVESAHFIKYGTLYDLDETEVIVCAEECQMCSGGWPQDAFDYVMDHNGLPLQDDAGGFDGDWLLSLTKAALGESDELDESTVSAYKAKVCPNGGGSGSQDNKNDNASYEAYDYARYASIEGYGYATDRCVCYTDGSGCSCSSQNEGLAVRNLATYGPAVVCVDASLWQDYTGGVITSSSGCSQEFMDVNHCVQAVGYAFASSGEEEGEAGSRDGEDKKSGSRDDRRAESSNGQRQGYWIVRNQWSKSWGYYGYAYVAMGENTCGILNDMVQVYA